MRERESRLGGDLVRRAAEGDAGDAGADEGDADECELALHESVWDVFYTALWRGDDDAAGGDGGAKAVLVGGGECIVRSGGGRADGGMFELCYSGGPEPSGGWGEYAADGGCDDQF